MSEMNTPKDSRTGLSEKLDGILTSNPNDLCAAALKEMLPQLPAAQAEKILNRLSGELSNAKGEETAHAPQLDAVAKEIEALKDEYSDVRQAASGALGSIGAPAVPQLIEALKDEDSGVREAAAEALEKIKDPSAVPQLIEALKDKDKSVRYWAAKALGEIKDPSAVPQLIVALKDEDSDVRWVAAEALGEIKDPSAVPALCKALKDWGVRRVAAWALQEIKDPRAVPALCSALKYWDWDSDAKIWLVEMLGEFKDPRAVEPLAVALLDNCDYLRWNAAEALGAIGDESATGWLCESLLEDEDLEVRKAAARALGKIKDPSAVPALIEAQTDGDDRVRRRAFEALVSIGAPAVPALCEALKKNQSWWLRLKAVEVLQAIGDPSAIKTLNFRLNGFLGRFGRERDIRVRLEIKDAIQKLEGN